MRRLSRGVGWLMGGAPKGPKRRGLGEGRFRLTYRGFPQLAAQPCASCWGAERPRHCRCTSSASRCRGRWCQLESWTWPWKPLSVSAQECEQSCSPWFLGTCAPARELRPCRLRPRVSSCLRLPCLPLAAPDGGGGCSARASPQWGVGLVE